MSEHVSNGVHIINKDCDIANKSTSTQLEKTSDDCPQNITELSIEKQILEENHLPYYITFYTECHMIHHLTSISNLAVIDCL